MRTPIARLALVAVLLSSSLAEAGGMFLPVRGARSLARAGAFVGGADDLQSIWFNPAGLSQTANLTFMLEAGMIFQRVGYDRVDSGGKALPTLEGMNTPIPVPFLGVAWRPDWWGKRLTFALAAYSLYGGVATYPDNGPQRYSLVSNVGTGMVIGELAVSVRVLPQLFLGAGFQNGFALLSNIIATSGCTELNCSPEDRAFDAPTHANGASWFTPSGNFGALFVSHYVRVGLAFQLPYSMAAKGTMKTRLPVDPQFDGAVVVGDEMTVYMDLPWMLRGGVEVRPRRDLRIEVGLDYEAWQMQDKIIFEPKGVYIDHVPAIGRYDLATVEINRSLQGVFIVRLGGEMELLDGRLMARAGYVYETSAVPDKTMSVMLPDGDKHMISLGLGVRVRWARLDLGYAHFFQPDRTITNSEAWQLQPIRPGLQVPVGNGTYRVATDVLSLSLEGRFR